MGCPYFWHERNIDYIIKINKDNNMLFIKRCKDLGEYGKQLLQEYNYDKNVELGVDVNFDIHSKQKLYWTCKICGTTWMADLGNRICNKTGCPHCAKNNLSFPENFIYNALKSVITNIEHNYRMPKALGGYELDICLPEYKLVIEYDGYAWHEKPYNNRYPSGSREQYKTDICKKYGLRLIHVYDGGNTKDPVIKGDIIQFKYDNSNRCKQLKKVVNIILSEIHIETKIDYEKIEEYTIRNLNVPEYNTTLAYCSPELVEEWDFENNKIYTPDTVRNNSMQKVHWICKRCGGKWESTIHNRTYNGNGCPICYHRKIVTGVNDLETLEPKLAAEYHPTLNIKKASEIAMSKDMMAYWRCTKCGYGSNGEWQANLRRRYAKGYETACPKCGYLWKDGSYKKVKAKKLLVDEYPELVKEYNTHLNNIPVSKVLAKSSKKVYWKCIKCGYGQNGEWITSPCRRSQTNYETACPKCKYFWKTQNYK